MNILADVATPDGPYFPVVTTIRPYPKIMKYINITALSFTIRKYSIFGIFGIFTVMSGRAATVGPFDFTSQSVFDDNFFRASLSSGTGSTFAVNNGKMVHTPKAAGGGITSWVYDTSPDATATNADFSDFAVSLRFSIGNDGASFGVYLYDAGTRTDSLYVQMTIGQGINNDVLSFYSGASIPGATGGIGTQVGSSVTLGTAFTTGVEYDFTMSATNLGNGSVKVDITLSDPSSILATATSSYTFTSVSATAGEIGFRSNMGGGSTAGQNTFDLITVETSSIPEPGNYAAVLGVMSIGLVGALRTRKFKK